MDAIEALNNRRSIKKFNDRRVERDVLDKVLDAGKNAACGMGLQSPKFLVIQRKDIIERFSQWNYSHFPDDFKQKVGDIDPLYGASTLIIVLADSNVPTCVEDASLAIGNMLNAAFALGLGACWIHRAREEFDSIQGKELLKVWGLSTDYIGVGHVILGYPADDYVIPEKKLKDDYVLYLDDII